MKGQQLGHKQIREKQTSIAVGLLVFPCAQIVEKPLELSDLPLAIEAQKRIKPCGFLRFLLGSTHRRQ